MPSSPSSLVREFHEAFDLVINEVPTDPGPEVADIRSRLVAEEAGEVVDALGTGRLDEIAHELADLVYVAYGTAISYGIDLDAVFAEVHRANMSKLGTDGKPVLSDGKVVKGPQYIPPDVAAVLRG